MPLFTYTCRVCAVYAKRRARATFRSVDGSQWAAVRLACLGGHTPAAELLVVCVCERNRNREISLLEAHVTLRFGLCGSPALMPQLLNSLHEIMDCTMQRTMC